MTSFIFKSTSTSVENSFIRRLVQQHANKESLLALKVTALCQQSLFITGTEADALMKDKFPFYFRSP